MLRSGAALCRGTSLIRNRPPPSDPPRALGIGLLWGLRGGRFLMSEVSLYAVHCLAQQTKYRGYSKVGTRTALGSYGRPIQEHNTTLGAVRVFDFE